jgi:hypothetical protein
MIGDLMMNDNEEPLPDAFDKFGTNLMKTSCICRSCNKRKQRVDFMIDVTSGNPDRLRYCRECLIKLLEKPSYKERAFTNLLKQHLYDNDYDVMRQMIGSLADLAIEERNLSAILAIIDRADGPVKQKMEVDVTTTEKLVDAADDIVKNLRKNNDDTSSQH